MPAPLLHIDRLSLNIPTDEGVAEILSDVSIALNRGESIGVVGESGCGKSMTALAVMGLLPEAAQATGAIRFDGDDLLQSSASP
jgi:peptide/nickel transport system ATP-binding protein